MIAFDPPLVPGRLIRRYKRFLADVRLDDGREVTAHCPNTGAMTGVAAPGMRCFVSAAANPKRKLAFTLEAVEADGTMVGINTAHPNRLAAAALEAGLFPEIGRFARLRREIAYGRNSRIDILLDDGSDGARRLVEVKNVHLRRAPGLAEFPDCVTTRGAKHLDELAARVVAGDGAFMLYLVQRADVSAFRLARDIDPAYGAAFDRAVAAGVGVIAAACTVSPSGIAVDRPLPLMP